MLKAKLETNIISASNKLMNILSKERNLSELPELQPFLDAWLDLVDYYRDHDDDQISISVVEVYRFWVFHFAMLLSNFRNSELFDASEELIGFMDKISEYNNDRKNLPRLL